MENIRHVDGHIDAHYVQGQILQSVIYTSRETTEPNKATHNGFPPDPASARQRSGTLVPIPIWSGDYFVPYSEANRYVERPAVTTNIPSAAQACTRETKNCSLWGFQPHVNKHVHRNNTDERGQLPSTASQSYRNHQPLANQLFVYYNILTGRKYFHRRPCFGSRSALAALAELSVDTGPTSGSAGRRMLLRTCRCSKNGVSSSLACRL